MFGVGVSLSDEFAVGFSWGLVKAKLFCLFFFLIFNFFNEIKFKKNKNKNKTKKKKNKYYQLVHLLVQLLLIKK